MKQIKHFFQHTFFLQASFRVSVTDMQASVIQHNEHGYVNIRVTNRTVSIMNTVDVTVVVTVLANVQVQIVLDL